MRYYPFRLSAPVLVAGDTPFFDVAGNFVRYDEETSGAASNKIDFTTDTGEFFTLKPGQAALLDRPFRRLALVNKALVSTLSGFIAVAGRGAAITDANIQGSVTILGSVAVVKPSVIDTIADIALGAGAATQILAADSARQQAFISNLAINANVIRVGDANVTAARGLELSPGQTLMIAGTEAIYGFDVAAESVGVAVVKD